MNNVIHINGKLQKLLVDLESSVSLDRVDALEEIPRVSLSEEVVPYIVNALSDEDTLVRLAAAEALGNYPSDKNREILREFIVKEDDDLAKAFGLSSLGFIGELQDVSFLLEQLEQNKVPHVRIHILEGLYDLVRRKAKNMMSGYLADEDVQVRGFAAEALKDILAPSSEDDTILLLRNQAEKEKSGTRSRMLEAADALLGEEEL
jgi:HEAT repeat protein